MTRLGNLGLVLTLTVPLLTLGAQEHAPAAAPQAAVAQDEHATPAAEHATPEAVDIITPHIMDGYDMELPYWRPPFAKHVCLGRMNEATHECGPLWEPVQIGAVELQLSPTKHVVMLMIAAILATVILVGTARAPSTRL